MMKYFLRFLASVAVLALVTSCNCGDSNNAEEKEEPHKNAVKPTTSTGNFGEAITIDGAVEASELPQLLNNSETVEAKLTGKIEKVCQMSGCWMDVDMGDGEIVHVTFKDDAFLMPKDAAGKTTIIEGVGTYEEIPVKLLKHLAEDEGKSQEEIDAITKPKMEYTFVAKGVIIQ